MFPALECLDVEGSETPGRPGPGLVAVPPNPDSADQVKVSLFSPFPCFGARKTGISCLCTFYWVWFLCIFCVCLCWSSEWVWEEGDRPPRWERRCPVTHSPLGRRGTETQQNGNSSEHLKLFLLTCIFCQFRFKTWIKKARMPKKKWKWYFPQ